MRPRPQGCEGREARTQGRREPDRHVPVGTLATRAPAEAAPAFIATTPLREIAVVVGACNTVSRSKATADKNYARLSRRLLGVLRIRRRAGFSPWSAEP